MAMAQDATCVEYPTASACVLGSYDREGGVTGGRETAAP